MKSHVKVDKKLEEIRSEGTVLPPNDGVFIAVLGLVHTPITMAFFWESYLTTHQNPDNE